MATVMLNVRLDKSLKACGDRVLAKQGISATEAIRGLYRFLDQNEEVPEFCKSKGDGLTSADRRQRMRQLVGIAKVDPGEDLGSLKKERLSKMEF